MRLYKQKDIHKPRRSPLDLSPGLPSAPSGSQHPDRLKRAAEVVSKQISGHKAMVAQFKEMKLPRPSMFSSKLAVAPQTDRPRLLKQGKDGSSQKPPTVPVRPPKAPASAVIPKRRSPLSNVSTNSSPPAKPPGLGSEKANPPVKTVSTFRPAAGKRQSLLSPIRSQQQRAGPQPAISAASTPTGAHLADIPATPPPKPVGVDEPILFVSCFHSLEEDPELEDDPLEPVDLMSSFQAQVARIFSIGLGSESESEVVKHGEVVCPMVTPEATSASTLEPMSAIVEWWEPAPNSAIESVVATEVKSQTDNFVRSNHSAQTDGIHDVTPVHTVQPPLSVVRPATSAARFDSGLAKNVPCQPPSSTDYGYVSSISQGAFGAVALGIHKQSRRHCVVRAISSAIVQEESVIRAVLAEQRIMRDASGYPFLLGLLASFHDNRGFYLVSVSFCSPHSAR